MAAAEVVDINMENVYTCYSPLILQWHITSRCNQRCRHCYQDTYEGMELDFESLITIIDQYKELLSALHRKGHINVTGGEPFLREDFFDLLEVFKNNQGFFSFGILTNGSLLNQKAVEKLKKLNPAFIQVSIEGDKEIHDSIRGEGNLELVLCRLKLLSQYGIKTLVSFTAHKGNYESFPRVVDFCRKNKVFKVWTDRIVPFGTGESLKDQGLSPEETLEFFRIVYQCKMQKRFGFGSKTLVEMNRSLQFLVADNAPYRCGAGESLITVMEDGTVLPCRRLPITAGNIKDCTLLEIYRENPLFKDLRAERAAPQGCSKCSYYVLCGGGARCISYALMGDPFGRDPGCPIQW